MRRLSGWDAMMLYSETADVPTHTLKIAIIDTTEFDGDFTVDLLRRVLSRRLPVLEPLRYELLNIPIKLHHPMWLQECKVDLDYHVRRVEVPAPGSRRELDDLISDIAEKPLDRTRPLWEVYFVEGMPDRRLAIVTKMHHALADGVASANLLARAVDPDVSSESQAGMRNCTPPPTGELLRAAGRDHVQQIRQLPAVIKDTASGISKVRRRSKQRGQHPELARPFSPSKTFINHRVSPGRRFASATLALADAKQTSKQLGVTLNELVLAISTRALRELLLRYDGTAGKPIIASVPVNTDPSPDRIAGNAMGGMFVSLPVHIDSPLEQVQLTRVASGIAKENNQLLGPELMGRWTTYMPPPLAPLGFRWLSQREMQNSLYNVSVSNVRGPQERGRIGGATISEFCSVGPLTPGCGMNITVWSYVDQLNISILTDDRTLSDAHEATNAMLDGFAEIREAAGLSSGLSEVPTAMSQAARRG
ncbi:wax ester/triacylglycerol synthase family O-acyltransferase [Mycobacterium sp. UM_CSW]|uniref:WS/DGAT/MGAT family O-acyltransferase n=1 Tax=Mycobacterium sp. UM_CSW TaxID=1370119 RepID=UPI00082C35A1|nr:wax ester/triacylglycerol synthase family O-acyltransferase [Mycobacterium sp. UM_CSW]